MEEMLDFYEQFQKLRDSLPEEIRDFYPRVARIFTTTSLADYLENKDDRTLWGESYIGVIIEGNYLLDLDLHMDILKKNEARNIYAKEKGLCFYGTLRHPYIRSEVANFVMSRDTLAANPLPLLQTTGIESPLMVNFNIAKILETDGLLLAWERRDSGRRVPMPPIRLLELA